MTARRWLAPAFILLAAAGLAWWGSRVQKTDFAAVEAYVGTLIDPATALPPDLPIGCADKLVPFRDPKTTFDVRIGDLSPFGDGTATHTVNLSNATGELGLRLVHEDGVTSVVGCWEGM